MDINTKDFNQSDLDKVTQWLKNQAVEISWERELIDFGVYRFRISGWLISSFNDEDDEDKPWSIEKNPWGIAPYLYRGIKDPKDLGSKINQAMEKMYGDKYTYPDSD